MKPALHQDAPPWRSRAPRYTPRPSTLGLCRLDNSRNDNLCLTVRDVSEGGACLVLRLPLPKGCEVEVLFLSARRLGGHRRRATVVWQTREAAPGGGFLTGLRFHEPLRAEELLGYVALLPGGGQSPRPNDRTRRP